MDEHEYSCRQLRVDTNYQLNDEINSPTHQDMSEVKIKDTEGSITERTNELITSRFPNGGNSAGGRVEGRQVNSNEDCPRLRSGQNMRDSLDGGHQVTGSTTAVLLTTNSNYCTFKQNSKRHSRNPSFNQNNITGVEDGDGKQVGVEEATEREKLVDRLKNI